MKNLTLILAIALCVSCSRDFEFQGERVVRSIDSSAYVAIGDKDKLSIIQTDYKFTMDNGKEIWCNKPYALPSKKKVTPSTFVKIFKNKDGSFQLVDIDAVNQNMTYKQRRGVFIGIGILIGLLAIYLSAVYEAKYARKLAKEELEKAQAKEKGRPV